MSRKCKGLEPTCHQCLHLKHGKVLAHAALQGRAKAAAVIQYCFRFSHAAIDFNVAAIALATQNIMSSQM